MSRKVNNPFHIKWLAKKIGKVDVKMRLRSMTDAIAAKSNYPGWCGERGRLIIEYGTRN